MNRANLFKWINKVAVTIYVSRCLVSEFFLGAFAKLRMATISFVISVRPTVSSYAPVRFPLDRFS